MVMGKKMVWVLQYFFFRVGRGASPRAKAGTVVLSKIDSRMSFSCYREDIFTCFLLVGKQVLLLGGDGMGVGVVGKGKGRERTDYLSVYSGAGV